MKYRVVLFQPFLRKHILNFGKHLRDFEFVVKKPTSGNFYRSQLPPSFEKEVHRVKTSRLNKWRRYLGLLNVRLKLGGQADLFFTYGCLLLTATPYCVYIENGVTLFNYDARLIKHPLASLLFAFLVRRKSCKKLIFMSHTGQKSFWNTVPMGPKTKHLLETKSTQIYPVVEKQAESPKIASGTMRFLFVGMFYIKGGLELLNAFERVRERYNTAELTVITPVHTLRSADRTRMVELDGLHLIDATLDETAMRKVYSEHQVFLLPTFRDSSPLVLLEALSWGMPIICTDQYATTEVAKPDYNALVYPNHPLKDYDPKTFRPLGKYYNPRDFYRDLFRLQKAGALKPLEEFIYHSMERFLIEPDLLPRFSQNALDLYDRDFHQDKMSAKLEAVFREALSK